MTKEEERLGLHITDRGFKHMRKVPSVYGGEVLTYEASSAEAPRIWLKTKSPVDLNNQAGEYTHAIALLSLEDAELLRDQLDYLIKNHYQLNDD